jgi:hypothetical protein
VTFTALNLELESTTLSLDGLYLELNGLRNKKEVTAERVLLSSVKFKSNNPEIDPSENDLQLFKV